MRAGCHPRVGPSVRRGRLIGGAKRNLDGDADENQRAGTGGINDVFGACDAMERACSGSEVAKKFDTGLIFVTRLHQHTIQPYRLAVAGHDVLGAPPMGSRPHT